MDKNGYQAHPWYDCIWDIKHIRNGGVIWSESKRNALVNQGEANILSTYFRNESAPTAFYIRLCNDTINEDDTLLTISGEPTATFGYAPILIERSSAGWGEPELDAGDYRITSKTITFTASGGSIGPISTAYLATTADNSGVLLASNGLSIVRTILDGDSLEGTLRVKLQ